MFIQRTSVAILLGVFFAALIYFARFTSGDAYPAYSSLRSDQSGARLLYLALEGTGKLTVSRNYLPLPLLQTRNAALLFIGVNPMTLLTWNDEQLSDLERLARAGNRITIGVTGEALPKKLSTTEKYPIGQRWGISRDAESSSLQFLPENGWVAESDGLLSKSFGSGRILLLTETSLLTNQALADGGIPPFLPFLVGSHLNVVMDETHLGVEETGSIAGLARHYHLGGLLIGLLLLAALIVWNRAARVSLPPPNDELPAMNTNRDVLVSLLERNLTSSSIVPACIAEWSRSNPGKSLREGAFLHSDPVAAYREIQHQVTSSKKTYP